MTDKHPDDIIAEDYRLRSESAPGGYGPACVVAGGSFGREEASAALRDAGYAACFRTATASHPPPRDLAGRMLAGHWQADGGEWVALYLEMLPPSYTS